jgi:hypothetical protein
MKAWLTAGLLMVLAGCGKGSLPDGVISEAGLVNVLVDIHLAESAAAHSRVGADSSRVILGNLFATVFSKHGISRQQLDASLAYYKKDPPVLDRIYEKVIEELTALEVEWANKYE